MTEKIKNILVITTFVGVITIMLLVNIIKEDTQISVSERRKLEQFPEISFEKIVDGSFFSKFDKYVTDQFVARETFRKTKVLSEKEVFRKLDYNNIYEKDGMLIEQLYPLNEKSILNLANKINWSKEQLMAIQTRGKNIIVSAGAGSGKTEVLSERVIYNLKNMCFLNLAFHQLSLLVHMMKSNSLY